VAKLDKLRQRSADARSRRDEVGWKLSKAEGAVKPDAGLIAHLMREYKIWQNRYADLEAEIARLEG
jgi:hypothetical protein